MANNLVIVESPAKAKTIVRFLGKDYKIEASVGHVRDLPKSQLGVDVKTSLSPNILLYGEKGMLLVNLKRKQKTQKKYSWLRTLTVKVKRYRGI